VAHNKSLHRTVNPLRAFAAGELKSLGGMS
jgi:hypothetical protein